MGCVVSASLQGFSPLLLAQFPGPERERTFLSDIRRQPSTYAQQGVLIKIVYKSLVTAILAKNHGKEDTDSFSSTTSLSRYINVLNHVVEY